MQTITINIEQTPRGYEFCNGTIAVARIHEMQPEKHCNYSRFALYVANKPYTTADTLAMAVELVSDKIEALFSSLGFNVDFAR